MSQFTATNPQLNISRGASSIAKFGETKFSDQRQSVEHEGGIEDFLEKKVGESAQDKLHNLLPRKLRAKSQLMVSSGQKTLKGRNSPPKKGLDGRLTFSTTVKQAPIKGHKFIPITQETNELLDIMRRDVNET